MSQTAMRLLILLVLISSGCSASARSLKLSKDIETARGQLAEAIPAGSDVEEARQILKASGFRITDEADYEKGTFVWAVKSSPYWGIEAKWIVSVYHSDGIVERVDNNFGYVGP